MDLRFLGRAGVTLLAFLTLCSAASAAVISKVPYTITKPGQYTLIRDLHYTGNASAITINADNVSIDLKGYTIDIDPSLSVPSATAGIFSNLRKNITVRNGVIRGFFRAIFLEGDNSTGGHVIEDIRADACAFLGIQAKGNQTLIRRCQVLNVSSATVLSAIRYGIHIQGNNCRVEDNDVSAIVPVNSFGGAYGIYVNVSIGTVVAGNRVRNIASSSSAARGIGIVSSPVCLVERKQVISVAFGVEFASSQTSKYRENVCVDCFTPYSGTATDAGNND